MRRHETAPIQKVTLNLFDGDFNRLRELHPALGAGKVIRELVRAHIKDVDGKLAQRQSPQIKLPLEAIDV